jgi:hypothetical protein
MIIKTIFILLLIASVLSGLLPIGYGTKYYKAFNTQLKALFIYLIFSVLTELVIAILTGIQYSGYNSTIQFIFTIFEFLTIAYIFWNELNKPILRIMITSFIALYFISLFASYWLTQKLSTVIDIADISEAGIIIILSVIFFFKVLTDLEIPKLTDYPFFWLNSAFLMYFGTTFFLYLFNNAAKEFDQPIVYFLAVIHHIMNITYNILITIALCKVRKT